MVAKRAFSLIELLIVISIIGILIAVATVSYSTVQKRSRDSRRITDLKAVQQGLEQYYPDHNSSYPTSPCSSVGVSYLPSGMPTDPKTGLAYSESCTVAGYCVCAGLEVTAGNSTTDCGTTSGTWYCIHNTQ